MTIIFFFLRLSVFLLILINTKIIYPHVNEFSYLGSTVVDDDIGVPGNTDGVGDE